MLDDISPQVIADGVSRPLGATEEMLHTVRRIIAGLLGELPGVLTLDRADEPRR